MGWVPARPAPALPPPQAQAATVAISPVSITASQGEADLLMRRLEAEAAARLQLQQELDAVKAMVSASRVVSASYRMYSLIFHPESSFYLINWFD